MSRQRGSHEGSYRQTKSGSWEGRITIEHRPYQFTAKTKSEVKRKIADLLKNVEKGFYPQKSTITLGQYVNFWLEEIVKIKRKQSTYINYKNLTRHFEPISAIRLTALRSADLQKFISSLTDKFVKPQSEKSQPRKLSPRTINLLRQILRAALNHAIDQSLISHNAAEKLTLPRQVTAEQKTLSRDNITRLFDLAPELIQSEPLLPCALIMILTGLRRGEALALKWNDIELENKTIQINQAFSKTEDGYILTDPKTKASKRLIPLPDLAKGILQELFEKSKDPSGFIFCHEDGSPYYPDSFRKILRRILNKAGLPTMRVHDLRHTCATNLMLAGVNPKIVQEFLGHTNVTTTLSIYSHTNKSIKETAAQEYDAFLKPKVHDSTKVTEQIYSQIKTPKKILTIKKLDLKK